jgi:hypothetical protein
MLTITATSTASSTMTTVHHSGELPVLEASHLLLATAVA